MDEDSERLHRLAHDGRLGDLRFIVAHLPSGATAHGASADRALAAILSRATAGELIHFEAYGRKEYGYWTSWGSLRPADVHRLPVPVHRLATFHGSGYVRESAVAALSARDDEDDLPYLLLRMNDWVESVALRAATAVSSRIDPEHAPSFVRWLGVVAHLRSVRRRDVVGPLRDVDRLLASPAARDAVRAGLRSGPRDVRRQCIDIVANLPDDGTVDLLVDATSDRDPPVAARAIEALCATLSGAALRTVLAPLVHCGFAGVRLRALRGLCANEGAAPSSEITALLFRALLDPSGAIRELARYELRRSGHDEAPSVYMSALATSDGRRLLVALCGIGECGASEHAAALAPFTVHTRTQIRAVAVKALVRLAPDANVATFFRALQDPSPRVARAAYEGLRGKAETLDRASLLALLDGTASSRTACLALALLCEGDLWAAIGLALHAVRSTDPEVRTASVAHLDRLLGRDTYVRPENLDALETAAKAADDLIPRTLWHRLRDGLAAARLMR